MTYGGGRAIAQYQAVTGSARVADATPHELILLMLDGALARIASARGAMAAGEAAQKGMLIGKAIGLVQGLKASLDSERGGDLAENLRALYEYMSARLVEANLRNDPGALAEVTSLLQEVRSGWLAIADVVASPA